MGFASGQFTLGNDLKPPAESFAIHLPVETYKACATFPLSVMSQQLHDQTSLKGCLRKQR
jgi:hypothetical protein